MWDYIYGIYSNHAIGSSKASGEWKFVQYPSKIAPPDKPEYSIPMSELSQAFFTGGERADGSLTNATWAFDGTSWTEISLRPISEPLKGMTIVPFYNYLNSKENSKIDVILAFGGTERYRCTSQARACVLQCSGLHVRIGIRLARCLRMDSA